MMTGEKATEAAAPLMFDLQLFAEGEAGSAGDGGTAASNTTSSIIPGDDYASGGPEPPDTELAERVDFEGFALDSEPEGVEEGESETDSDADEVPEPVKREQSPEANAAFAELRRQAEQAKRELQARDAWVEQNFGASHNLHTWEQYQQAIEIQRQREAQAQQQALQTMPAQVAQQTYRQLIEAGYDDAVAREVANARGAAVEADLKYQALQNRLNGLEHQTKQQQEQAARQQQEEAARQIFQSWEADRAKLREEYGDLVPESLDNIDQAVAEKLKKGYSFEDAWITANRAKILEHKEKAAAQKTLNNLNSKKHLKTEGDGGTDSDASTVPLSAETLAMYMDSGMTEKQARAFHKKLYG